jgi:hypothetical protein
LWLVRTSLIANRLSGNTTVDTAVFWAVTV